MTAMYAVAVPDVAHCINYGIAPAAIADLDQVVFCGSESYLCGKVRIRVYLFCFILLFSILKIL